MLTSTLRCRGACAKRLCDYGPVLFTSTGITRAGFDAVRWRPARDFIGVERSAFSGLACEFARCM